MMSGTKYDWVSMAEINLIKEAGEDVKLAPDMKEMSSEYLMAAKKTIFNTSVATSILLCVVWPVLSVPAGVFTKSYFAFWVFIALLWGLVATFVIIMLPLYESYDQIMMVLYGLMGATYTPEAPLAAPAAAPVAETTIEMAEPPPDPVIEKAPEPEPAPVAEPEPEPAGCGLFQSAEATATREAAATPSTRSCAALTSASFGTHAHTGVASQFQFPTARIASAPPWRPIAPPSPF